LPYPTKISAGFPSQLKKPLKFLSPQPAIVVGIFGITQKTLFTFIVATKFDSGFHGEI